jgi:predicted RNA-binding Zn-ribbon protein involved in translation (DUF1610 family)
MTTYTIKYRKGERVIYDGNRQLTKKEVKAYDKALENKNLELNVVCENCGNHSTSRAKKDGYPRKKLCPECGEAMVGYYNPLVKKDESQVRRMVQRFNHEGYNKDQAHQFYDSAIASTKRRIEGVGGASHYKAMIPDMDYMVKNGLAKPVDGATADNLKKSRKDAVVKAVGDKKNFKPGRSNGSQSIK